MPNQADFELAQAASNEDVFAQKELLERLLNRVLRTVSYLAGGDDDRQDLAQLALMEIVKSAGSFRGDGKLENWADRITIQTAAKQFEKKKRRKRLSDSVWNPPIRVTNPEQEVMAVQVRKRVAMALESLSPKQRIPVVLHYLHGYEVSEIATMTKSKINTVRGRLRNGKKKLKKKILKDPSLKEWLEGNLK